MAEDKKPFYPIHKAASHDKTKTPNYTEKGQPGIINTSAFIQDLARTELQMPQRLYTVDQMCLDSAVATSLDFRTNLLVQAMNDGEFKSTGTAKSDVATEFANYLISNLSTGSWLQAMRDAATYIKYGFAILNPVVERKAYGKYKGAVTLKKLAPRSQKSVYGWVWDDKFRDLKGFVQKPMKIKNQLSNLGNYSQAITINQVSNGYFQQATYPYFKANEFLIFSYNSTNNNPQGDLLAAGCFEAYIEKKIIEQYELSGLSKDLGGIVVGRSPSDLFEKAADPVNFPEAAQAKNEFETDLGNVHVSKTTFVHLQSDRDERGNYLYDFELKGVQGAGKSYSTTEVIKEKNKAIYNRFSTQALLLGQDGSGSFALSKDQMTTFQYAVYRDMAEMADVINSQLLPMLLAANDIYLDSEDMPVFTPLNPFKLTHDEAGKFGQRMKSVGLMTPAIAKWLHEDLGAPIEGLDDLDYTDPGTSRAGDGMKTAGEGTAKTVGGGDKSVSNNENGGVLKSFEFDGDKIIVDGEVVNADQLENGEYK